MGSDFNMDDVSESTAMEVINADAVANYSVVLCGAEYKSKAAFLVAPPPLFFLPCHHQRPILLFSHCSFSKCASCIHCCTARTPSDMMCVDSLRDVCDVLGLNPCL